MKLFSKRIYVVIICLLIICRYNITYSQSTAQSNNCDKFLNDQGAVHTSWQGFYNYAKCFNPEMSSPCCNAWANWMYASQTRMWELVKSNTTTTVSYWATFDNNNKDYQYYRSHCGNATTQNNLNNPTNNIPTSPASNTNTVIPTNYNNPAGTSNNTNPVNSASNNNPANTVSNTFDPQNYGNNTYDPQNYGNNVFPNGQNNQGAQNDKSDDNVTQPPEDLSGNITGSGEANGATGAIGTKGDEGVTGTTGTNEPTGTNAATGVDGATGSKAEEGATGSTGDADINEPKQVGATTTETPSEDQGKVATVPPTEQQEKTTNEAPTDKQNNQGSTDENNGDKNNYHLEMGYNKDKGSTEIKKVDDDNSTVPTSTPGSATSNSSTDITNSNNSEGNNSAIGSAAGNIAGVGDNSNSVNPNAGTSVNTGTGSALGAAIGSNSATIEGLNQLENIIKTGKLLSAFVSITPFIANLSDVDPSTPLNISTMDWSLIAKAAKACSDITKDECYKFCTIDMAQNRDKANEEFWIEMSNKFR
ncbi:MAG: collagen-like protein [Bacteroidales bacterium]|jgi:hypothetical protein